MKTPHPFSRKPTQLELAEGARRKTANRAHAINDMMHDDNRPTRAELAKLREKRPELWNAFPESSCIDA